MHGRAGSDAAVVVFSVIAETDPGSELRVVGSVDALGRWHPEGGVALRTEPGKYPRWSGAVRLPNHAGLEYKYIKVLPDLSVVWEDGPDRRLPPGASGAAEPLTPRFGKQALPRPAASSMAQASMAQPPVPSSAFAASPAVAPPAPAAASSFAAAPRASSGPGPGAAPTPPRLPLTGGAAAPSGAPVPGTPERGRPATPGGSPMAERKKGEPCEVQIEATCTATSLGDVLRVVGSVDALGNWQPEKGLLLTTTPQTFPRWHGKLQLPCGGAPAEWKLVISRAHGQADWEKGPNRRTRIPPDQEAVMWIVRVHWEGSCSAPEPRRSSSLGVRKPSYPQQLQDQHNQSGASTRAPSDALDGRSPGGQSAAGQSPAARPRSPVPLPPVRAAPQVVAPVPPPLPVSPRGQPPKLTGFEESGDSKQCRRSTSLSHLPEPMVISTKDQDPFKAALEARARKVLETVKVEDQQFSLRLRGVRGAIVPKLLVEVVVDGERRWPLRLDTAQADEARWVLSIPEAGLQNGLHLFHFTVEGERLLSSEHTVFGESNAIIFSESIRRYILARDAGGYSSVAPPVPIGRSNTNIICPDRPLEDVRKSHDDGDVHGQQKGNMARPWSCAFNLSALGDEEEEMPETKQNIVNFSKEVFEGLYDAELRLRIDNYVLPEAQRDASQKLVLWPGAHLLKKKVGACEDAYFTDKYALGVADGVGCMVQFASYGINAAAYAAELMEYACASLQPDGLAAQRKHDFVDVRAAAALSAAENNAQAYGASTITVLVLDGHHAGVANLGDSGFMLLRKAQRGMTVVKRSEEQQHSWNCPYQLTRLPPALISRFPKVSLDTAADCEQYRFEVQEGDLLLLFTDGLRDNLHEREILHIVDCVLPPPFGDLVGLTEYATPPENIARALALAAQERSLDPTAKVPFVEYSKKHGYQCIGGKQDDITVVAAWVMPERGYGQDVRPAPALPPAGAKRASERVAAAAAEAAAARAAAAADAAAARAAAAAAAAATAEAAAQAAQKAQEAQAQAPKAPPPAPSVKEEAEALPPAPAAAQRAPEVALPLETAAAPPENAAVVAPAAGVPEVAPAPPTAAGESNAPEASEVPAVPELAAAEETAPEPEAAGETVEVAEEEAQAAAAAAEMAAATAGAQADMAVEAAAEAEAASAVLGAALPADVINSASPDAGEPPMARTDTLAIVLEALPEEAAPPAENDVLVEDVPPTAESKSPADVKDVPETVDSKTPADVKDEATSAEEGRANPASDDSPGSKAKIVVTPSNPPARIHRGHSRKFEGKYDTPRRGGSGYDQQPTTGSGASPNTASTANAAGAAGSAAGAKGRPPQCRAEFRPMSSSKQGGSKGRPGSGTNRRFDA